MKHEILLTANFDKSTAGRHEQHEKANGSWTKTNAEDKQQVDRDHVENQQHADCRSDTDGTQRAGRQQKYENTSHRHTENI